MKGFKGAFFITLAVAVLMAAYIVLSSVGVFNLGSSGSKKSSNDSASYEETGFSSPEDCVETYMEYFQNGDFDGMLSCYAIDTFVDNYDMEKSVERLMSIQPMSTIVLADDDFSRNISVEEIRYNASKMIRGASWYLSSSTFLIDGYAVALEPGDDAKDLIDEYLPSDIQETLSDIEYNGIIDKDDDLFSEYLSRNSDNIEQYFDVCGSDNYECLAVDFSLDGDDYYLFLDLIEYNNKWYISPSTSYLSFIFGLPTNCGNCVLQDDVD